MKLAAIYNTFDGEELLEGSIRQIYELCAEVIIVWQERSNYGYENICLATFLLGLQHRWPNIRLIRYYPDLTINAAENERQKRIIGLDRAGTLDCTHFLFMDNDEYYDTGSFSKAMRKIEKQKFDATACRLYTYFKSPCHRLTPMEQYWVPFICKINAQQKVGQGFPVYADPTRGILPVQHFYSFQTEELVMHHYSYVRKDIRRKIENSSARANFGNLDLLVKQMDDWQPGTGPPVYPGHEVEQVEDRFGITTGPL